MVRTKGPARPGYPKYYPREYWEVDFGRSKEEKSEVDLKKQVETPRESERLREPQQPFRFMDLPAELRVYVYQFLLPYNMNIIPKRIGVSYAESTGFVPCQSKWCVKVRAKDAEPDPTPVTYCGPPRNGYPPPTKPPPLTGQIQRQIFLVSKKVSKEALAMLYKSNTYKFIIDSNPHIPNSLQSPRIFGPFGESDRLPLLRNLRSISIAIVSNKATHWCVKRQRARFKYFVSVLKQHSDDDGKKSLLHDLTVHMHEIHSWTYPNKEDYMFSLESLADLRGIKDVSITGVPDWFAQCLQLCIQGSGGDVREFEWTRREATNGEKGKKRVKGRKRATRWTNTKRKVSVSVETRKWWQPMLDWKEFAVRNGVSLPDDIDKYWTVEE